MRHLSVASLLITLLFLSEAAAAGEVPRTRSGRPDFSGNYDISNLTPFSRPKEFGVQKYLTDEQIAAIAKRQASFVSNDDRQLDPERGAPEKADDPGAYNYFWLDFGTDALPIDGRVRTSVIIDPPNGQMPENGSRQAAHGPDRPIRLLGQAEGRRVVDGDGRRSL